MTHTRNAGFLPPTEPGYAGPCLIIGEIAQAHDGSVGFAHAYIDAIAAAGADAVKFQTHIAAEESTPGEPWRVKFSKQDESRYAYWKRMEFTEPQWRELKAHAEERGLLFLSSPFSVKAADMLARIGVSAWKVASGEVRESSTFERMASTGLPMYVSTGMSSLDEVDDAVRRIRQRKIPFLLMQCTTAYPCPPAQVGLNLIPLFRERYGCAVGLSDHSGTIYPGLAASALGIAALEIHVTMSREMFGPDVVASVTTAELGQLVEGIRFIEAMTQHPVSKDRMAEELAGVRALFTKSIVARTDLPAGTLLTLDHLAFKKPGTGIPEQRVTSVLHRKLKHAVAADTMILEDNLD
jgi:N,N'-diacetyllegionaminate synthase